MRSYFPTVVLKQIRTEVQTTEHGGVILKISIIGRIQKIKKDTIISRKHRNYRLALFYFTVCGFVTDGNNVTYMFFQKFYVLRMCW